MSHSPYMEHKLRDSRKKRVIVLEELNFLWDAPELAEVTDMWMQGEGIQDIAKYFDRDPDEIILALMHLARSDRISQRKGGLLLGQ
ncbi:hypothetical protein PUS82_15470 [Cytobacillus firmus]|uniref:hypothetical protein n=1 Tax=Cytobacillus firmus TaxID=1399 RepID=UPI00237B63A8|nr:hypothetical protein [Cytobacillus firmus]MDD9312674.1 hypothetical protein [Cytobacillus firmus]